MGFALPLLAVVFVGCSGTATPSSPGATAGSATAGSATAAPASTTIDGDGDGEEQTYEGCPLSLAEATSLAKEPMEVQPVSRGDGSFRSEVVGENTTWICTFDAVAWSSNYNFSMHIDFSVGGSADRRWAILGEPSAQNGWTKISRLRGDVWEDVSRDEEGKHDIALEAHGAGYLINVGVADYGGTRTGDEVRALADELLKQVFEVLPA